MIKHTILAFSLAAIGASAWAANVSVSIDKIGRASCRERVL